MPKLSMDAYPTCREDFEQGLTVLDKAQRLNGCTSGIDQFYNDVMLPYRQAVIAWQTEISSLYTNTVAPSDAYRGEAKDGFYASMMDAHRKANPDGENMAAYRAADVKYKQDRAYLQDRYCFVTGCGAYAGLAAAVPAKPARSASANSASSNRAAIAPVSQRELREEPRRRGSQAAAVPDKCGKARKRGSAFGSLLGGVAGSLGGLGESATALASGFSGMLVGEIACKLTQDEQVRAAEATVAVTRTEEVGATAQWTSPTRSGVTGSSTVTALNAEPNGRRCLNITDVAIIDGEETRVAKRMCRGRGDAGYTLDA